MNCNTEAWRHQKSLYTCDAVCSNTIKICYNVNQFFLFSLYNLCIFLTGTYALESFHFFRHSNVKRCYFCTVLCIHLLRFYSQLLSLSGYLSLLLQRSHDSSSTFPDPVLVEKPCSLKQTHQEECSTLFQDNLTRIFTTYQFLHFTCNI